MKINVVEITPQLGTEVYEHEAPVVDHETNDGELRITERDTEGKVTGWKLYAAGHWLSAEMDEPMSEDVKRERALAAERDRIPANGTGPKFTVPGGNSGPQ
jgi:hypothetical protein